MTGRALHVISAGPGVTVQDQGRPGYLDRGLSRGGAADTLAVAEGAALLGQNVAFALLEMAGMGGTFRAGCDLRIALTGAPMRASIDSAPVVWNASYLLPAGSELEIGAANSGVYGYLHVGGGVETPLVLGSRSAHLAAGLGQPVTAGTVLPVGPDTGGTIGLTLDTTPRFSGGVIRILRSLQTDFFPQADLDRFESTQFLRDARANRMGVKLTCEGAGFHVEGGLSILSEVIVPGDIQVTGDGTPFVLLPECQTTGGYPRIGTVLPSDLPKVAQAGPGAPLSFKFIQTDVALEAHRRYARQIKDLPRTVRALVRDPHDIPDLLSYQLISGMIADGDT